MYMSNSYSRRLALCSNVDMVQVVAAVLQSGDKILVGQRMPQQSHPLKWEFPGGKVEPGESPEQALARELEEELGISGASGELMTRYHFTYPGKDQIELIFFRVRQFSGEPKNLIFHDLRWHPKSELDGLDFVEGDREFIRGIYTSPLGTLDSKGRPRHERILRQPRKQGQTAESVPARHGQPPRRPQAFHPVLRRAGGSGFGGSPHQDVAVPGYVLCQPVRILYRRQPPRRAQSGNHGRRTARARELVGIGRSQVQLNSRNRCISYAVFCLKKLRSQTRGGRPAHQSWDPGRGSPDPPGRPRTAVTRPPRRPPQPWSGSRPSRYFFLTARRPRGPPSFPTRTPSQ